MTFNPRIQFHLLAIVAAVCCCVGMGCVMEPTQKIDPMVALVIGKNAKLVAKGKPPVVYKIDKAGQVSVLDQTAGAIVGYAEIRMPGQRLVVDGDDGTVSLKNIKDVKLKDVLFEQVDPTHDYAVYFAVSKTQPKSAKKWWELF